LFFKLITGVILFFVSICQTYFDVLLFSCLELISKHNVYLIKVNMSFIDTNL